MASIKPTENLLRQRIQQGRLFLARQSGSENTSTCLDDYAERTFGLKVLQHSTQVHASGKMHWSGVEQSGQVKTEKLVN